MCRVCPTTGDAGRCAVEPDGNLTALLPGNTTICVPVPPMVSMSRKFKSNSTFSNFILPVPCATKSKSALVLAVEITLFAMLISSTCISFICNPAESIVPTIELFAINVIVSFVGCTLTLVFLSSDVICPNVNTD